VLGLTGDPDKFRILANCVVGLGFSRRGFAAGLAEKPDLIGCDAGSADLGPSALGSGNDTKPRRAIMRDLAIMVEGAAELDVPLVVGSCGGAGGERHLERYVNYVAEICAEKGIRRRAAVIHAQQSKQSVREALDGGRITSLGNIPALTAPDIDASNEIVGMMGVGPFLEALADGAQIILAGRSTDPAIFAGGPLLRSLPAGPAWHCGKSIDKGYLATTNPSEGSPVIASVDADGFTIKPAMPSSRCTVRSVSRLTMHENPNPFRIIQPSGEIDTERCTFTQLDDNRSVRVTGSEFHPAPRPSLKLEGAKPVGHRAVAIIGIRDPRLLAGLDDFLSAFRDLLSRSVEQLGVPETRWSVRFRQYGRNAVLGDLEPLERLPPREIGLVIDVVADTPELAADIVRRAGPLGSRLDSGGFLGGGGAFAYPFSPNALDGGEVFEWSVWHVMAVDDETDPFAIEYRTLG
jgi:hypothetical protein